MDAPPRELSHGVQPPPIAVPMAGLVLATALIRWFGVDLGLARWLHGAEGYRSVTEGGWGIAYHFSVVPGWVLAVGALLVLLAGLRCARARRHWRGAALLVAALALGPGVLVNVILKDHTGRPRPYELQDWGGPYAYREAFDFGTPGEGHAFPSGHAAMGFYLLTPFFVCWAGRRRCAWWALAAGSAFGAAVGLMRMMQGGHFLSDVLWAWGVVYLVGWGLWWVFRPGARGGSAGGGHV